jgi:FAD/FMN-containing dehydrogenase
VDEREGAHRRQLPEALRRDLAKAVDGEERFDSGTKAAYSTDSSNYRQVPLGVVIPHTTGALAEAVAVCHRHGAPVTHRGAGTSLGGQTTNACVVIDGSKYLDEIIEINAEEK